MITLEKIDQIVERTGATYEKAKEALTHSEGDVVEAIIYLENNKSSFFGSFNEKTGDVMDTLKEFLHKGNVTKVIVEKDGEVILSLPVTVGAIGMVMPGAPLLAAVGFAAAMVGRYTIKVVDDKGELIDISKMTEEKMKNVKKMAEDLKSKAADVAEEAQMRAKETAEKAGDLKDQMGEKMEQAKDKMADMAQDSKEAMGDMKDKAQDKMEDMKDKGQDMKDKAQDKMEDMKDKGQDMKDKAQDKMEDMKDKGQDMKDKAQDKMEDMKDKGQDMKDKAQDKMEDKKDKTSDNKESRNKEMDRSAMHQAGAQTAQAGRTPQMDGSFKKDTPGASSSTPDKGFNKDAINKGNQQDTSPQMKTNSGGDIRQTPENDKDQQALNANRFTNTPFEQMQEKKEDRK